MRIGVPREIHPGEMRVATTPDVVTQLQKLGFTVSVESGAGAGSSFDDEAYRKVGATITNDVRGLWASSDIILKVRPPEAHPDLAVNEVDLAHEGQVLIAFLWPAQRPDLLQALSDKGVTALAMDSVPRISRAQKVDALSSMANIAGYRAVIEAAEHFGRFFTGQITAAGKIPPAKVLVIGAGVAGLAAIGTARALGAIVRAFDTRPEVKEQVKSMDADFLELDFKEEGAGVGGYAKVMSPEFIKAEMALFAAQAKDVDIIITTALIPGKPAPKLITAETAASMRAGSVIVDLAAEQGGNCELTVPGEVVKRHGVTIIGYTDLPSRLAAQSSQLYATNLRHLLDDMCPKKDGQIVVDFADEVVRGATVVKGHEITWPPPAPKLTATPTAKPATTGTSGNERERTGMHGGKQGLPTDARSAKVGPIIAAVLGGAALFGVGAVAPPEFLAHFTVFVLACFVGYMVVWNVTPALHTPLMSVTNAISSIIIVGAILQISSSSPLVSWMAAVTVAVTSVNIAGGFAVTRRMLEMFRK
jgi:H+-translocating NAD(P) transhydrogenase subunit alpha